MNKLPEVGKTYKHYKGGTYIVLSLAKHTETEEVMVVYKSKQLGSVWVRPLERWVSKTYGEDGKLVRRFKKVKNNKTKGELYPHPWF